MVIVISVYGLSALTAALCSALLLRGYRRNSIRLLLWAGICFAALALEGIVLIANEIVVADLTILRLSIPLVGLAALTYGLLWESDSL